MEEKVIRDVCYASLYGSGADRIIEESLMKKR